MTSALDQQIDAVVGAITAPGGMLAVGEATVRGATYPVFANAPASMRDYLAFFFAANAAKEFLVYRDERYTFAEVHAQAMKVAAVLQSRGVAKGDRVAIAMRNYPDWITAYCGALILGAVAVPLNAWWKGEELAYGIAHSGTRLVIADEERARRLADLPDFAMPVLTVRTSAEVAAGLGYDRPRRRARRCRCRAVVSAAGRCRRRCDDHVHERLDRRAQGRGVDPARAGRGRDELSRHRPRAAPAVGGGGRARSGAAGHAAQRAAVPHHRRGSRPPRLGRDRAQDDHHAQMGTRATRCA